MNTSFFFFSWNDRASPISLESSDVDIENVTLSTNVTCAGDSSYHIVDDSVIISRDVDSDNESSILGSDSIEDEDYSFANSRYKIQTICY